jgi:glucan phosphoethanolaminetransferase (alkaline phosphatase superfamily)
MFFMAAQPQPTYLSPMSSRPSAATSDFRRMILWISFAGVLMVIGALWYLSLYTPLYPSIVIATVGGVFLSVVLGCGLFAAAFFSDKSGHDRNVTDATRGEDSLRD